MTLKGGVIAVAVVIVTPPKILPAKLSQLTAAAPLLLKESAANAATALTDAKSAHRFVPSNFALSMARSRSQAPPSPRGDEGLVSTPDISPSGC